MDLPVVLTLLVIGASAGVTALIGGSLFQIAHSPGIPDRARSFYPALAFGGLLAGWWLLTLALALGDTFRADDDAQFPLIVFGVFAPILLGYSLLRTSATFRDLLAATPLHWLIGIQVYRSLGALFLWLYARYFLPGLFAIPAGIGDLLVGVTAPLVAYGCLAQKPWSHRAAVTWNLLGIADLALAVGLGFFSAPGPFRVFFTEPSTALMTVFPLVMIPTFAVPLSVLLHLFALRRLSRVAAVQPPWRQGRTSTAS
jgi:hypothetical protein